MVPAATCIVQLTVLALSSSPDLIPPPHEVEWAAGSLPLPRQVRVSAPAEWLEQVEAHLWLLDETLQSISKGDRRATLLRGTQGAGDASGPAVRVRRAPEQKIPRDGYELTIDPGGVTVEAGNTAGVLNAFATLAQLIEQTDNHAPALPTGRIRDWPILPVRTVHIDMTCQQYRAAYVCRLMRILARYKVNAILMEYSGQFPFQKHRAIRRPDAFNEQEIEDIRRTAVECGQEIIPFLQCLGHLEYVLHQPELARYGQAHAGYMLCPSSPEAAPFACSLIDEVLAQHPGLRRLHIGGDEVQLNRSRPCPSCDEYVKQHGFSSLYVRHYRAVAEYCRRKGVTPLMWSDMMLHSPEALPEMPRDVAWVVWDYDITSNPARSLFHGASMSTLDKLGPAYRQYFGGGIGLKDAAQRGGLEAFGHALGFTALGFSAFTAPAARCGGDNFNLPRFSLHMKNIRTAFLQAARFKLPGSIVTSWSYRASPHEVCLPEYVCTAYGWNPATPDLEPLLAAFFRQRYGIQDPCLAEAVLAFSPVVPATMQASPRLDDARRAWTVSAAAQVEQLKSVLGKQNKARLQQHQGWLGLLSDTEWRCTPAFSAAARNQRELKHWRLSLGHLLNRLRLIVTLADLANMQPDIPSEQLDKSGFALHVLEARGEQLRRDWASLYEQIYTPQHLQIDLEMRFDAEKALVETVLSTKQAATRPAQPRP